MAKHHAKLIGWSPLSDVGPVTKPRPETHWNLLGCPKLVNRSQPLMDRSSPYCDNIWTRYCCSTAFPIVNTCLNREDTARQSSVMVRWWLIFGDFLRSVFSASRMQHISDLHSKFARRPHMCGSMADIRLRIGEEKRRRRRERRRQNRTKIQWPAPFHRSATKTEMITETVQS